jgi:polyhydroxyalkanoate synthase subunit PhaC
MGTDLRILTFVGWDGTTVCSHSNVPEDGGRGTVVLLHGFAQNHLTWHGRTSSLWQHLADRGWRCESVELRGHGESRRRGSTQPLSLADHLGTDLPAVLDGLRKSGAPRPMVAVGHSLGGLLLSWTAAQSPGAFDGLCAISTPGSMKFARLFHPVRHLPSVMRSLPGGSRLRSVPFCLDHLGRATALGVRLGVERFMPKSPRAWEPGSMEPELVRERLTAGFDRTSLGVVAELADWTNTGCLAVPGTTTNLVGDFSTLSCPALLVSSDRDGIVPQWLGLRPEHFPAARVEEHRVSGFGHCDIILGQEAPSAVWSRLLSWLDDL